MSGVCEDRAGDKVSARRIRAFAIALGVLLSVPLFVMPTGAAALPGSPTLDGTVSTVTAGSASVVDLLHTTGSGDNRLLLVSVTANSYGGAQTVSSVTFTPDGGSALALTAVSSIENGAGRLAAVYQLLAPPSGVSGTVSVAFSGTVRVTSKGEDSASMNFGFNRACSELRELQFDIAATTATHVMGVTEVLPIRFVALDCVSPIKLKLGASSDVTIRSSLVLTCNAQTLSFANMTSVANTVRLLVGGGKGAA